MVFISTTLSIFSLRNFASACILSGSNMYIFTLSQIEFIRSQSETLMNEIRSYEQEKTEQVLNYLEELMIKKDEIENVRVSAHKFLGDIHIRELITKKEKCDEIQRVNNTDLGTCDWQDKKLRIGKNEFVVHNFMMPLTF